MTNHKTALTAIAAAIALGMAGPSLAAGAGSPTQAAQAQQMQSADQFTAEELLGKEITNPSGDAIGDIESVIIDNDGQVAAVVVGIGGFLGMGEHEVAIDWQDLQIRQNGEIIESSMTKAQLEALPEYTYADQQRRGQAFVDPNYMSPQRGMGGESQTAMDRPADTGASSGAMTSSGSKDQMAQDSSSSSAADKAKWSEASELHASHLLGASVVNDQGDDVGEVEDIIISQDGNPTLVLSVGEFLGMGGHEVTIDLDQATVLQEEGGDDLRVQVSMTKDELKGLPQYKRDGSMSGGSMGSGDMQKPKAQ